MRTTWALMRDQCNPLGSRLSPLRYFSDWRTEQYYRRTLTDRALAEAWAAHYLRGLMLPPASRVIDHGCGRGRHTAMLTQLGHRVTGVDCTRHPWWSRIKAQFHVVEAPNFFPHGAWKCDLALDVGVVSHFTVDALGQLAQEIHRLLRADGTWIIIEANDESPGAFLPRRHYGRLHSLATMRQIAKDAGFTEIDYWYEGVYAPLVPRFVNFVRKQLWPAPMTIDDYGTWLERQLNPRKRARWVLRLRPDRGRAE